MSEKKAQKPEQKAKVENKPEPMVFGRKIRFEPTRPYGWFVVLFPEIHSESRDISLWLDNTLGWLRKNTEQPYTWALLHGRGKDEEIVSPVVYFKDRYEALRCSWLHSGTLQE